MSNLWQIITCRIMQVLWLGVIPCGVTSDTISSISPAPCLVAVNNPAAPLQSPQPAGVAVNIILKFLQSELYLFTGLVMETSVIEG